jgi:hypothetical protein
MCAGRNQLKTTPKPKNMDTIIVENKKIITKAVMYTLETVLIALVIPRIVPRVRTSDVCFLCTIDLLATNNTKIFRTFWAVVAYVGIMRKVFGK